MKFTFSHILFFCFLGFLTSCVPAKRLYYFHNKAEQTDSIVGQLKKAKMIIHQGDRLSITVSCQEPNQTAFLNPFNMQNSGNASANSGNGYLVNPEGNIDFPMLGSMHLEGLTSEKAADSIKIRLLRFFKDPYVYVTLNGRVYFLNGKGGAAVNIMNERLTLFEGLVQAGMQDPFDRRHKVWVVREENGKRTYARLNLNDKSIFESPYYYLQNNDLIYTEPGKFSTFLSNNSPVRNLIAISASLLALYLALVK